METRRLSINSQVDCEGYVGETFKGKQGEANSFGLLEVVFLERILSISSSVFLLMLSRKWVESLPSVSGPVVLETVAVVSGIYVFLWKDKRTK